MTAVRGTARSVGMLNVRRLLRAPLRSGLAITAVAGGVAVAVAVVIVITSIDTSMVRLLRTLAGPAPIRVVGPAQRGGLPEGTVDRIAAVDGVESAVPAVQAVAIAEDAAGTEVTVFVVGIDCRVEALVGAFSCDPAEMDASNDGPLLVSTTLAERLGPGGVVRTNVGRVPVSEADPIPALNGINGGQIVVFGLPTAQRLFDRAGRLDTVFVVPDGGPAASSPAELEQLRTRVARAAGPTAMVLGRDEVVGADSNVGPLMPMLTLVGAFALALAGLLVYNAMTLALAERRRDLAITAAVGGAAPVVLGGAVVEAALLGFAGGVAGTVAGFLLAHPLVDSLNAIVLRSEASVITVDIAPRHVVLGLGLGVMTAAVAALMPARRALRIDVAGELHGRAKREEAAGAASARRAGVLASVGVAGVVLTWLAQRGGGLGAWQPTVGRVGMIAAAFLLFAAAGATAPLLLERLLPLASRAGGAIHLAVASAAREPRRTSVIAVATGTAVGLAAVLGSLGPAIRSAVQGSIARSIDGRVYVSTLPINNSSAYDSGVPKSVLERLAAIPGVRSVDQVSFVALRDRRGDIAVGGFSGFATIPYEVVAGSIDAGDIAAGRVGIGTSLARSLGVQPGDTIRLPGPTGFVEVTVGAIWADPNNNGATVTMAEDRITAIWGEQRASDVLVRADDGVDVRDLAARIEAAHLDPDLYALTPDEMARRLSDEVEAQADPFWALQRALLVVTLIAALSTLLLVGVQRRRELAILGSVGLAPPGLAGMTLAEGAMIGVVGSALGTVASMGVFAAMLNVAMLQIGVRPPFRFDALTPIVYGLIASAVVLVGALLPAWRTSRVEIVDGLQYE